MLGLRAGETTGYSGWSLRGRPALYVSFIQENPEDARTDMPAMPWAPSVAWEQPPLCCPQPRPLRVMCQQQKEPASTITGGAPRPGHARQHGIRCSDFRCPLSHQGADPSRALFHPRWLFLHTRLEEGHRVPLERSSGDGLSKVQETTAQRQTELPDGLLLSP